ncbi:MAG TPA: hypothetical protein DCE41_32900 [Cytophagales bacterium]|nr:hypothetical protein [Cytophagales bacterium]HAA17304.1 hypothetical protein [Cytophagales bacterium]HAP62966.1 hypothetical protein [Cytophagales bacterium]
MKYTLFTLSLTVLLSSCIDVEDFFLSGGRIPESGEYTFEYGYTNDMLSDESMFFSEEERTLLTLETVDDLGNTATTYALYLGDVSTIDTDTVIVYCHGNASTIESAFYRATILGNVGGKGNYGILVPEYLGYGLADGQISEENMYLGVAAGLNWLEEQGGTEDRMVYYGVSLGSAPSVELTASPRVMRPEKLMLEAPLASIATLSQDVLGVALDISFFSSLNELDNISKISEVEQPMLLIHGTADDYIDYESNGLPLYNNYQGEEATLVPVEGATHINVPEIMGFEAYEETILSFLRK